MQIYLIRVAGTNKVIAILWATDWPELVRTAADACFGCAVEATRIDDIGGMVVPIDAEAIMPTTQISEALEIERETGNRFVFLMHAMSPTYSVAKRMSDQAAYAWSPLPASIN